MLSISQIKKIYTDCVSSSEIVGGETTISYVWDSPLPPMSRLISMQQLKRKNHAY
jgi:hypothetical protein